MTDQDRGRDEVNPAKPAPEQAQDEEQVAPRRAARRLYDEMAHAYHEQADLDLEISAELLPVAVESLRHEEDD